MSLNTTLLDLLEVKESFLRRVVAERAVGPGLLGYLTGAFSFAFFMNFTSGGNALSFAAQTLAYFILFVIAGIIFSAVAQMFLDLTAKTGNAPGLFALCGLSCFCQTLLVCGALLCGVFKGGGAGMSLIFTIVLLLQIYFFTLLVSRSYRLSKTLVFFSMAFAAAPGFIMALLLIAAGMAGILALIFGLAQ